jgi:hypothetical protein
MQMMMSSKSRAISSAVALGVVVGSQLRLRMTITTAQSMTMARVVLMVDPTAMMMSTMMTTAVMITMSLMMSTVKMAPS